MRLLSITQAFAMCLIASTVTANTIVVDEFDSGGLQLTVTSSAASVTLTEPVVPGVLGGARTSTLDIVSGPSTAIATLDVNFDFPGQTALTNTAFSDTFVGLSYLAGGPHDLLIDFGG